MRHRNPLVVAAALAAPLLAAAGVLGPAGSATGAARSPQRAQAAAVPPQVVQAALGATVGPYKVTVARSALDAEQPGGSTDRSYVVLKPRRDAAVVVTGPQGRRASAGIDVVTWSRPHQVASPHLADAKRDYLSVFAIVTKSNLGRCPLGIRVELVIARVGRVASPSVVCGTSGRAKGSYELSGALAPRQFTLGVGKSQSSHTYPGFGQNATVRLPVGAPTLTLETFSDLSMPPGWKLEIVRPGDPRGKPGGPYYVVCTVDVGESACDADRPGANSPTAEYDEVLSAVLRDPWGGWQEQGVRIQYRKGG